MRVLIVEDEQFAFEKLEIMLAKIDSNIEIIGHAKTISAAVEVIQQQKQIDLALFDIQLSDGLSFSIFDRVEINFPIIFTTAYDNHAIRAFKHNSVDYLLKPIRLPDLQYALDKFDKIWKPQNNIENLEKDYKNRIEEDYKERFTVKIGNHIKMLKSEEISCFYSLDKGSFVISNSDNNYLIDYSLDHLMNKLNPEYFFRVNRKFIININSIKDIMAYSNSRLKINLKTKTEEDIIVSREKVKLFKKWIEGDSE